jgi:hypothetical protein
MRAFTCLCALALLGAISCQTASNDTQAYPGVFPFPFPFAQGAGGNPLMSAIFAIQTQQYFSDRYRTVILDLQSAQGWMQVSQGWLTMNNMENSDDDDSSSSSSSNGASYDEVERATEMTLLHVLKLLYIQAANKLHDSHQSHYKTKVQLAVLQSMGAGNSGLAPLLSLMYYLETINVMSSAITIQKQDAWNTWLLHEIMETDEFGNSQDGLPEEFATTMQHSRQIAMQLYHSEAQLDLQKFYLEYMINMYVMQLSGGAGQQMMNNNNANNANNNNNAAAAASFLEEEAEPAEPNKPFFPMMMMGMMGGGASPYFSYMTFYLKYSAVMMNVQAAHGLMTHAFMDAQSSSSDSSEDLSKYAQMNKVYAFQALHQWAYLRMTQASLDMYSMFFSGAAGQQPAMAANASA